MEDPTIFDQYRVNYERGGNSMIIYYKKEENNDVTLDNINEILEFLDNSDGLKLVYNFALKSYYTSALAPKIFNHNSYIVDQCLPGQIVECSNICKCVSKIGTKMLFGVTLVNDCGQQF